MGLQQRGPSLLPEERKGISLNLSIAATTSGVETLPPSPATTTMFNGLIPER